MDLLQRIPGCSFLPALPSRRGRIVPSDEFAGHSGNPSAAFATARNLPVPLRAVRPPRFVEGTLCLDAQAFKRGFKGFSVDWLENVDRIRRTTTGSGAGPSTRQITYAPRPDQGDADCCFPPPKGERALVTIVTRNGYPRTMKTFTIRDFRTRPRAIREALAKENKAVLTASGRPVAVLLPVNAETFDQTLDVVGRAQALQALKQIQQRSAGAGRSRIGMREIDAEIDAARREAGVRKRKRRRA